MEMSAPEGAIYYTTDGSDPRVFRIGHDFGVRLDLLVAGGDSRSYATSRARVDRGAMERAERRRIHVASAVEALRIDEIMYNPAEGQAEFLELVNLSDVTIGLGDLSFTSGIEYDFPELATLRPGGRCSSFVTPRPSRAAYSVPLSGCLRGSPLRRRRVSGHQRFFGL